MSAYEEALFKVIDQMLASKGCVPDLGMMRHSLVDLLRKKIREIASRTSRASNHAGRAVPTYFDVEWTFGQMGIHVDDLKALCESQGPIVNPIEFPTRQTRDEDFRLTVSQLNETSSEEATNTSHIPEYLPPFPPAHTYKHTVVMRSAEKDYQTARECHAENQLSTRRALNRFYLNTEPTMSLLGVETKDEAFKVLHPGPPKQLACLTALMPDEILAKDVYEDDDEIVYTEIPKNKFVEADPVPLPEKDDKYAKKD